MDMNDFLENLTESANETRSLLNEDFISKIAKAEILRYGEEYEQLLYYPEYARDAARYEEEVTGEEIEEGSYIEGSGPWVITAEVGADLFPTLYDALKSLTTDYLDEDDPMVVAIKLYLAKSKKAQGNAMLNKCDGSFSKFIGYLKSL